MQVSRLEIEGVFSFGVEADRFALDFDERLTVIVGPNASGKSNVRRALNLVQTAVRFEDANQKSRGSLGTVLDDHVRDARHEGMPSGTRSAVNVALRMASAAEVNLMTSYVQMLVLSSLFGNQTVDTQSLPALEAWVAEHVTSEAIAGLLTGTIVVSHSGIPGSQWNVAYEFEHGGVSLTWHINTTIPNLTNVIAPRERTADAALPSIMTLTQRLKGPNSPPAGPILPPETPFSIEALLPDGDDLVQIGMPSLSASVAPAPHRAFVAAAGISVPISDPLGPYRRSYSLAAVLSPMLDRSLWYLGVAGGSGAAVGIESELSGRLYALKNGDQRSQIRYHSIQALFEELAPGRRFEVRADRQTPDGEAPEVAVKIEVFPSGADPLAAQARPLHLAGTGVEQALMIAETLAGDPDRVLVLDEPATNLHPPWQRIVRSHLGSREGQCVLVTHSPYLIPADGREQLASIVRFSVSGGATHAHRLSKSDLADDRWVGTMVKELAWSADARGLLFAAGVVLLEGPTELAALSTWFARSATAQRQRAPDDLHVAFYSVGGDQDFLPFISYLERFGVPWVVVCDGAAFRFDIGKHIFEQVLDAGVDDPELNKYVEQEGISSKDQSVMNATLFASMSHVGKAHGVFTLAPGWHRKKEAEGDHESFEAFVMSLPELVEAAKVANDAAPRSKPRAGRLLAESTDCPRLVDELYQLILNRLWQKGMAQLPARHPKAEPAANEIT
jgi:hypothetical protein